MGVFSISQDLAPVIIGKKQGFVNRKGEIVIPLEYDARSRVTYFYEPGVAILTKNGKYGAIGPRNNIIVPFEYDKIETSVSKDCLIVTKGAEWATFSFQGRQMSEYCDYEIINPSHGSLPPDSRDLPMLITTTGIKNQREGLNSSVEYRNGSKKVKDSLKMGIGTQYAYMDNLQKTIVLFGVYEFAEPFGLGRKAIAVRKGKYGIIDERGEAVVPFEYDLIERPHQFSHYSDLFVATRGKDVTILDKNAKPIPIEGITMYDNRNGNLIVTDSQGKTGCVDYGGRQTVPFSYDALRSYRDIGFIAVRAGWQGLISTRNDIIVPLEYRNIYGLMEGTVFIDRTGKAGMLDRDMRVVIPFEYDAIYDTYYHDRGEKTRYIVVKADKVGTIDSDNNVIIPIVYDKLSGLVEYGPNAHFAKKEGKFGLISPAGQTIVPIEYDYVDLPAGGVVVVRKNRKYGAVSLRKSVILPCEYDIIISDINLWNFNFGEQHENKLVVLKNGVWSYLDLTGKPIRQQVPETEIRKKYQYRLDWGEPSNESPDFDMKPAVSTLWEEM